jgi:phosphoglycolate phosphatase
MQSQCVLLFDLDGTLVDPAKGIIASVQTALAKLKRPIPPAQTLGWVIGPSLRESFARILGGDARVEEAVAAYRAAYTGGLMYEASVYPGMRETLAALKARGGRLIVCTSKPVAYAPQILERFALLGFFDAVYGAELDGRFDDKAELMAHLIEREGVSPARALMIGDRMFDIRAAKANGVASIGVTWGYGARAELEEAGADLICERVPELLETIDAALAPKKPSAAAPRPAPRPLT